jgi:hypothetical protein
VVVPVGPAAATASPTGTCAPSWSSCAATLGGNCCPQGFECGTASCSSVGPSGTGVEQKQSPGLGSRMEISSFLCAVVGGLIVVMYVTQLEMVIFL